MKIHVLFNVLFLIFCLTAKAQDVTLTGPLACNASSTSGSFTVPCNVTSMTIHVYGAGAGGGGGGGGSNGGLFNTRGGGGAGAGAYSSITINVVPGSVFNYSIGAGGCGGSNGSDAVSGGNGTNGGNSFFTGTAQGGIPINLLANGGQRGTGGSGTNGSTGNGGLGGTASGGSTNTNGGSGLNGSGGNGGVGGAAAGPFGGAGGASSNAPGLNFGGAGAGGGDSQGGAGAAGGILIIFNTSNPLPSIPTINIVQPSCTAAGLSTISNFNAAFTYTFTPSGPTVGSAGEILNMTAGTSYTVTASDGFCVSGQSAIFSVLNAPPSPTVSVSAVNNVICNGINNGAVSITASTAPVPCSSPVVRINEILTDVSGGLVSGDGSGCGNASNPLSAEFIELIGPPGANIGCFVLTDGDWTITIPAGTMIPADGIFTIGNNNTPLHQGNGTVFDLNANSCQCFTDSCQLLIFTNGGEYLAIFNSAGTFVDGLIYGNPSVGNTPVAGTVIPTRGLAGCVNSVTLPPVGSFTTVAQAAEGNTISRIPDGNGIFTATPANTPNACNFNAPPVLTYQWSNGATTQNISGLAAGVYTVTVLDAQGCSSSQTATITEPSALIVTATPTASTCFGFADATVNVNVSGGSPAYNFAWSNGATTDNLSALAAGTYVLTVSDANACTITQSVVITQPSAISLSTSITDIICTNSNVGAIDLTSNGGTVPYLFQWSNGASTQNISGLTSGQYSVTVSDANNCQTSVSAEVNATTGLQLNSVASNVSCNAANDGCGQISVNGGTAPYDYLWSNGAAVDSICGLAPGIYFVTVTDNGNVECIGTDTIEIFEPAALQTNANITDLGCNSLGAIDISANGGVAPYNFNWQNGATTQDLTALGAGNYDLTVSDANACNTTLSITLTAPLLPQISAYIGLPGVSDSSITQNQGIEVNAGFDQSGQGVSYSWASFPSNLIFDNADSSVAIVNAVDIGLYNIILTATSSEGCIATDTIRLSVNPELDPKIPNAFSPNNDGTNDFFSVVGLDSDYIKEFKVYNRWGQLVYDNLTGSWDGTYNGSEQVRDTYLYVISWQLPSDANPTLVRGTVTLLK